MKKLYLLSILLFLVLAMLNSQDCRIPVSGEMYRQKYIRINETRQEQAKLTLAKDFAMQYCLTSQQVKEITLLFHNENNKLDFAQSAYCNTIDKMNYYDVYDAFTSFSVVFRLHGFVLEEEAMNKQPEYVERTHSRHQFPAYNYPSWQNYKDNTRCQYPASEEEFYGFVNEILNQYGDRERSAKALQIIRSQCLSVEQIMKIGSLLDTESNRLQYLKDVYPYTYDYTNYDNCSQLLTKQEYQNDFTAYIRHQGPGAPSKPLNPGNHGTPGYKPVYVTCQVTQDEMTGIIKSIDEQSFTSSKISVAEQIVEAKKCFTAQQIKVLVELISFESSKLEFAKFCYDYCIDPDNYYILNSCFVMSSNVENLSAYIRSKK